MTDYRLILGDCLSAMQTLEAGSISAIVTDPPYGLSEHKTEDVAACLQAWLNGEAYRPDKRGFMGKGWDAWPPGPEVWRECLRVLKPGGHMLCFAGTRSMDLMSMAIRLAGFELRDSIGYAWVYGSGFPKSASVSKLIDKAAGAEREVIGSKLGRPGMAKDGSNQSFRQLRAMEGRNDMPNPAVDITAPATDAARTWDGWGTALKPAWEPIILARKPLSEPTIAANVLRWGCGALNIDATRIAHDEPEKHTIRTAERHGHALNLNTGNSKSWQEGTMASASPQGRWPANLLLDSDAAALLDEMSGERGNSARPNSRGKFYSKDGAQVYGDYNGFNHNSMHNDTGGASRFFYVAKASKRDRDEGLEGMPDQGGHLASPEGGGGGWAKDAAKNPNLPRKNGHPTVKPTALMRWLVRLITPPGGTVLDCFAGSGSTGKAAMLEGFDFIGIDTDSEYLELSRARIEHAQRQVQQLPLLECHQ